MTKTNRTVLAATVVTLGSVCWLIGGVRAEPAAAADQADGKPAQSAATAAPELQKVTVRGRCVDERNNPLADAKVYLVRRLPDYVSHVVVGETRTDAEGRFEFADVETALPERGDLSAVAAKSGYASASRFLGVADNGMLEKELQMSSEPVTLSGVVQDPSGKPIPGVTVFVSGTGRQPLPDVFSSVTDADGHYEIKDLKRWTPESTKTFDPKTGVGTMQASFRFQLKHPDYPDSTAQCAAIPGAVDVTLYPPAIVEGQVVDTVTNQPAAGVPIFAQGVARDRTFETTTDAQGRYRLRMTADHYNIWAYAEDRIAVAVKTLEAKPGTTISDADIPLVRGGFVVGTVFDADGQPLKPTGDSPLLVAHYGPARPQTGAAVTSTPVQPDGTYRLRVAPGRNYVYCMNGAANGDYIDVNDGQEVVFDIHLGVERTRHPENADQRLARQLRAAVETPTPHGMVKPKPNTPVRQRPDTPIGKLLDELEQQNSGPDLFDDPWALTLKQIIELGPAATPQLIAELDATNDGMMLSCLGFSLRAINDKRAVPALIRAIPKTLRRPGSDMGLRAKDNSLAIFMRKHDLDQASQRDGNDYDFGRPVREIFGALNHLTGQSFDEEEIFSIFAGGTDRQNQLKRELFHKTARKWATWWETHGKESVDDQTYTTVGLPEIPTANKQEEQRYRGESGGAAGWVLSPYTDPQARIAFYDLDTGRAVGLPEKWKKGDDIQAHREEILAWAAEEGFDLMGTEYQSPDDNKTYYALSPIGLQAWELGRDRWKSDLKDVRWETLEREGRETQGWLLHFDREQGAIAPAEHAPFLFRTNEGTTGILNVGVEVYDTNVVIGEAMSGDPDLDPVAFRKGRRFGWRPLESPQ